MRTILPHSIGVDQTVKTAKSMLSEYRIRHLPVQQAGQLVGIVTDRDINFAMGFELKSDQEPTVEDVYMPEPYIVPPTEPLDKVVLMMAQEHYGSVLVVDQGKLMGIITTVDVCRAFGEFLRG